jgi:L-lysine 6-transaminase
MIGDGFPLVVDLANSRGSWLVDLESGERYLDLYSFFASLPLGFNHPALHEPRNAAKLLAAAAHKPSNSDAHTPELASFVECFSQRAMPEPFRHLFFVEGGAMAVENALKTAFDWKVRKNLAAGRGPLGKQILHFRQAFHGRSGYTLSLTKHATGQDRLLPEVLLAARREP